jgi:hypothetical protein
MKYPNECKCGKPTHGMRLCAACKGEAQQEDGLCLECTENLLDRALSFEAIEQKAVHDKA